MIQLTDEQRTAILDDLREDGDVHKFEADGMWTFTLHIEQDECMSYEDQEDPEVFGRVEVASDGYWRSDGHPQRPDGFTGAARKFASESSQGYSYWYEPPKDFRRFKGSGFTDIDEWRNAAEAHFRNVRSVVSWGYVVIGVKARHVRPDGYERDWSEWIGGVENPIDVYGSQARKDWDDYVHELVGELLDELLTQIEEEA